ncbi:MAG: hypothetical protein ACT4NY_19240 [Pseudonocardiales bacterium]
MSQAKAAPVGWVQLPGGYTIRWRRGDPVAHVLPGRRADDHGMAGVVGTIAVSPSGWTDLAEIRQVGQRWLRGQQHQRGA